MSHSQFRTKLIDQIDGFKQTALLYVAAKLNLADLLFAKSTSAETLAAELHVDSDSLRRTLRALSTLGFCHELKNGDFEITEVGQYLRSDVPDSQRKRAILAVEQFWEAWGDLLYSVRTSKTAFDHVHGMSPWEFRQKNPALNECFNDWLAGETARAAASIVAALDFSNVTTIADIAGGNGQLLSAILQSAPHTRGILLEQEHLLDAARTRFERDNLLQRSSCVGGDIFESIPVEADVYILKSVIHDWNDEQSLRILKNCRAAVAAKTSRLLLIERLLPESGSDASIFMLDLHMMLVTGGRERSLAEYKTLLNEAKFSLERIIKTDSGFSILESFPL